jgi:PEP-CTERM motif
MRRLTFALLCSLLLLTLPATAATVLTGNIFHNSPIDGTIDGWSIYGDGSVSDSFTVASGATAYVVNFGAWLNPGDSVSAVKWSIGTTPFGADTGTGTVTASSGMLFNNLYGYDIDKVSFSLADGTTLTPLNLAPGTYYLTLQDAASAGLGVVYWDENDGANSTAAYVNSIGQLTSTDGQGCADTGSGSGTCSESFDISTPEPSTLALLCSGILAAFVLRRKAIRR